MVVLSGDQLRLELPDGYHHHLAMMNVLSFTTLGWCLTMTSYLADSIKSRPINMMVCIQSGEVMT